ncbi:MAG: glycoside hydrolase family 32 protein [Epulopiscium sp.]|nr:glycoside hydrolase family 32 protein [Candidatus Epulonipiscium sp.]
MIEHIAKNKREYNLEKEHWRPAYHFSAPKGWLNDPNGLIYYKGYYHLFYQHNPKHCNWDSMHWGHAISKDMMHWKDLPIALAPDLPYDNDPDGGCFSGSAVEKDGILYLFYTGAIKGGNGLIQTQCMAYSEDGVHFKKYEGNPIISLPPSGVLEDFRDPKVFSVGDKWYMVIGGSVGGAEGGGDGRIYLYASDDLLQWEYKGNILESNGKLGTMFECPDMFELNGKWVVTCFPIFHPKNNKALYCVGTMDFENCEYHIEHIGTLDAGFDYYASQSFLDENGNRVLIGWLHGFSWMPWFENSGPTDIEGWRGTLSIPRVATLDKNNQLHLQPISNLDNIKTLDALEENIQITKTKHKLNPSDPHSFEIKISGNVSEIESRFLEIGLLVGNNKETKIELDFIAGVMTLDRSNSDVYTSGKVNCIFDNEDKFDLQVLVDHSCIEVILNKGRHILSANVYPEKEQTECYIRTPYKSATLRKVETRSLKSVW